MARRLEGAPGEIRVLFTPEEADAFLHAGAPLPGTTPDDPLQSAARRVLQSLVLEFAVAAEGIELCVEPIPPVPVADAEVPLGAPTRMATPRLAPAGHDWYAVHFRLTAPWADAEEHRALDAWMAEHVPALSFAIARATEVVDGGPVADAPAPA